MTKQFDQPPVQVPMVTPDGKPSTAWQLWFHKVQQQLSFGATFFKASAVGSPASTVNVVAPNYTIPIPGLYALDTYVVLNLTSATITNLHVATTVMAAAAVEDFAMNYVNFSGTLTFFASRFFQEVFAGNTGLAGAFANATFSAGTVQITVVYQLIRVG